MGQGKGEATGGEWVRSGIAPELDGMEFISARYRTHRFPLHVHCDYVIGAVVRGIKSTRHGRRLLTAGPGEVMLLNPYEEHESFGSGTPWVWAGVYPGRALIHALFAEPGGEAPRFAEPIRRTARSARQILALHRMLAARPPSLASQGALITLVAPLFVADDRQARPASCDADLTVRRTREALDEDLACDLSLTDLSRNAGVAPLTLLRAFRRSVGCTPHTYRTARRLAAAKQALRRGQPAAEVAAEVGFCDQSHLSRVFRRWTGTTPGAFTAAPSLSHGRAR